MTEPNNRPTWDSAETRYPPEGSLVCITAKACAKREWSLFIRLIPRAAGGHCNGAVFVSPGQPPQGDMFHVSELEPYPPLNLRKDEDEVITKESWAALEREYSEAAAMTRANEQAGEWRVRSAGILDRWSFVFRLGKRPAVLHAGEESGYIVETEEGGHVAVDCSRDGAAAIVREHNEAEKLREALEELVKAHDTGMGKSAVDLRIEQARAALESQS